MASRTKLGDLPAWITLAISILIPLIGITVSFVTLRTEFEAVARLLAEVRDHQSESDKEVKVFYKVEWPKVVRLIADVPRIEKRVEEHERRIRRLEGDR